MAIGPYRTTPELVEKIVEVSSGVDLESFIAMGNQLTTDFCGGTNYTPPYPDGFYYSKMEMIERLLAAHFYQMFDLGLAAAKAGSVGAAFQVKVGYGLNLTVYGQNAMLMDTGGNLAKANNSNQTKRAIRVGGDWLGDPNIGLSNWFYLVP